MFSPRTRLPMRFVEARALVRHRRARKIVKEKTDQIEHGRGLENHGPAAGRGFGRVARGGGLFAGAAGQGRRDRCSRRSGELALAQPEESDSRMVMENSARVWRCEAKRPRRVGNRRLRHARRKNSGGGLLVFFGHFRDAGDGAGAVGRRRVRGVLKIARDLGVFLRAGHRQQIGIARLAARQRFRGFDHAPQRIVVGLVGGRARRAAVEHGAHGNGERPAPRRSGESCCWRSASARR